MSDPTQVPTRRACRVPYAAITRCGGVFQTPSGFQRCPFGTRCQHVHVGPTTPLPQRLAAWHGTGLGLNPVRSPLLRVWFTLPQATEMFQFAWFPPPEGGATIVAGCPIRKSWDQRVLAAPPRISLRCHVLLRHAKPGHPPCALHVFFARTFTVSGCCAAMVFFCLGTGERATPARLGDLVYLVSYAIGKVQSVRTSCQAGDMRSQQQ